jgi:hypothetical protein
MSRRSRGRYSAGVGKKNGTPTIDPPTPQAIDDYSGFKVPLSKIRKDWQGLYSVSPDIRNPQDFVRGVKDDPSLPFSRPEAPDEYIATALLWEDGRVMLGEDGRVLLSEGLIPGDTL